MIMLSQFEGCNVEYIHHKFMVMLYKLKENDEYIHHNLMLTLYMFTAWNDKYLHHKLVVNLHLHILHNDEYIHDDLEKYHQYILYRMMILFVTI